MFVNTFEQELKNEDFRRISQAIYRHCGIHLTEIKKTLVRARLAKRLKITNIPTFSAYVDFVLSGTQAAQQEFGDMVDVISTNFTSFFREMAHFGFLRQNILAPLRKQYPQGGVLRIWSAASSSGEEPYTIAITLLEELEGRGCWNFKILATDVSRRMLERAQAGSFDQERVEPLTPAQKQRFLVPNIIEGQKVYQVAPAVKQRVQFQYLNLMDAWSFRDPFDVIFCRNVMIYFDKPTQERLVNRMYDVLKPGGYLFIGHSESLTGIEHPYRYIQPAIHQKPEDK
ncbi:MAG: protein-glutamate O-methyltransferase [Sedimentisphaerales bacterium]|nr:protein-glutamate O-methyltransferase [Sedimentisphaerales bacterium]